MAMALGYGQTKKKTKENIFRRHEKPSLAQETYNKSCQTGKPQQIQKNYLASHPKLVDKENIKPGQTLVRKRSLNIKMMDSEAYKKKIDCEMGENGNYSTQNRIA